MTDIELTLDRTAVEPGGTISGTARWTGTPTTLVIELGWKTRGKGDKDEDTVLTKKIPVADRKEARFEIDAPLQPFSFSGSLISLAYYVTASITGGTSVRAEVVIAPGGTEVVLART